jgi:hypothetical protein
MIVELTFCLAPIVATVVVTFFTFRWWRDRRWRSLALGFATIALMHVIVGSLVGPSMRGYVYRTADANVTFLECPFKGVSYEAMLKRYHEHGGEKALYRTFDKDWWNYYRWYDYATHPRWKLPYLPDERSSA